MLKSAQAWQTPVQTTQRAHQHPCQDGMMTPPYIYIYIHTHICTTPSQDTLYIVSACSVYNTKTGDAHVAANHQSVIGICPQDEQFENITAADANTERSKS